DPQPITPRPWPIAVAVVSAGLAVLAWHLVAPLISSGTSPTDNLSWGVAFYGALPWPVQALGVLLVLAALAWAWRSPILDFGVAQNNPKSKIQNLKYASWLPWLIVTLAALAFSIFEVTHSEGDSSEFDAKIPKGAIWRERELLDFYVKARLWQVLRPWLPLPSQIYALVATVSGCIYLVGTVLVGKTLGRSGREVLVIVLALVSIGNI